jgi:hypothetical protein
MPQSSRRALIATKDPVAAALLGLFVETVGLVPVFLKPDEELGAALVRLRPVAVTLLGIDAGEARSDVFFAHSAKLQTRVVLYGQVDQLRDIAGIAAARGVGWFTLPPSSARLQQVIAGTDGRRDGRRNDRRGEPTATIEGDGIPIFVDRGGVHWIVYDRRTVANRRQAAIDRMFISERGACFSYTIDSEVAGDAAAATLERQLASAMTDGEPAPS